MLNSCNMCRVLRGLQRSVNQVLVGPCQEEFVIVNARRFSGAVMRVNVLEENHHQYGMERLMWGYRPGATCTLTVSAR